MIYRNEKLRKILLRVAEDPNRPGFIDEKRLEKYLLSVEGKVVGGLKFACDTAANGERRWYVEEA